MGANIVISSAGHHRIARARAWLEARAPAEEVLIVGANLDAVNELARGAAQARGAAFGWYRLTLIQLAATLAAPAMAECGIVPLRRLGIEAVASRAVSGLVAQDALGRFTPIAKGPGFARAIASVVLELRMARLGPDALAGVAADLQPLLQAYQAELDEGGLTDWPGVLALAAEAAAKRRAAHPPVGLPTLLLDVPVTSELELDLIRAICSRTSDMLATVPAADEPTLARLRDGLRLDLEDFDTSPARGPGPGTADLGSLARLQRHLFKEDSTPLQVATDDQVLVFSAPGESRECVEIARRVLALAHDGLAFDRMAVLLRSPEEYRAHLQEAFARAGVPAHFARGIVRPDPAGRAFHALLRCAAEGLSARRFAEYLSLGQAPDATGDGAPPEAAPRADRWVAPDQEAVPRPLEGLSEQAAPVADGPPRVADLGPVIAGQLRAPRRWERLLVEAAVIGEAKRWRKRIDGLANELRLKLSELDEEEEVRAAIFERMLDDLKAFAGYALPLINALDELPESASWGEWLDQLSALATRALRQPDRVLSILSELSPMAAVGPITLEEVLLVLSDLLLEIAVPPPAQRYGRIFVGSVDAARGLSFEAVFVPGLTEKIFPRRILEEPILLDSVRQQLSAGLATNKDRLARERLAMALAAGAAERRLYFSYPRLDLDRARPRVPSFYALEAVRAAEGRLPDFAELARRVETVTSDRVGWPAPTDPAAAIDEAEYDLAVLDRLTGLDPEEGAGTARYLLTANRHLARALRARYQRWSRRWTSADGLVNPSDAVRAIVARHEFGARSYSPTALQNYAGCPYRFFLQAVHGLAPREVPEAIDELDPLQRGSLIHRIQFELFRRLQAAELLPFRPESLDQVRTVLDGVISEVAARYYDDLAPAIERVWEDSIAAIRADLREWLRRSSEDGAGYTPWRFELSFGLGRRNEPPRDDARSVPGAIDLDCGIQLRGSIDLVERNPSGLVRVTDYKTGKAEGKPGQLVAGGTALQPVLYALAAEKLFGDKVKVDCGRLYFCTSRGGFAEHVVPLDERARNAAAAVADTIGDAIGRSFLPAAPAERECARCDYRPVCGPHEERRMRRKPKESLEPLLRLRGMR